MLHLYIEEELLSSRKYGGDWDSIYLHGALKNRMTNALIESGEASLIIMLIDAMKLTKSAFHHSINYRSVTVFGKVSELKSDVGKLKGLESIVNHFVPKRWEFLEHIITIN